MKVRNVPPGAEGPVARRAPEPSDMGPLFRPQMSRVAKLSPTKFAAHDASKPRQPNGRYRVLELLRDVWPIGLTRPQIAEQLKISANSVNARVAELLDVGAKRYRRPVPPPLYEEGTIGGCALVFAYHQHPLSTTEAANARPCTGPQNASETARADG